MKKYLTLSLLLSTALLGCKKENGSKKSDEPKVNQTHSATFNIQDFGLTSGSLTTNGLKTNALKDQIKDLQYAVINWQETGHEVNLNLYRYQKHTSNSPDFGLIRDSLEDGRHHIAFVGADVSTGRLDAGSTPYSGGIRSVQPVYYLDYNKLTPNIFYGYLDTTVAGAAINKPIVMTRIVSQVTVHINDAIPSNAAKFVLKFVDFPTNVDLSSGYGSYRGRRDEYYPDAIFEFPVTSDKIGKRNMELCAIVFPYYYPEISVDCLDAAGNVISHKLLPKNYNNNTTTLLNKNTQYKFSGNMFGQTANFGVTIDTKWNTPIDIPFSIAGKTQKLF